MIKLVVVSVVSVVVLTIVISLFVYFRKRNQPQEWHPPLSTNEQTSDSSGYSSTSPVVTELPSIQTQQPLDETLATRALENAMTNRRYIKQTVIKPIAGQQQGPVQTDAFGDRIE